MKNNYTEKEIIEHDLNEQEKYSKMLSKTVHDINNPLAVFIGQISIMQMLFKKDKLTSDKLEIIIDKLESSTEKFRLKLKELRSFYKVNLNAPESSNLGHVVDSCIYYFEHQFYNKEINYYVEIDESLDFKIPAAHLFMCLKHIIQNAIESIENTDCPKLWISSSVNNGSLLLLIKDNGAGLQVELSEATNFGTTLNKTNHRGYGLSIVKALSIEDSFELGYTYEDGAVFSLNITL